jgi:gliding motility-associated-like protein
VVSDNQNPIITNCPAAITIGSQTGSCGAIVSWDIPSFTDNCGATMTSSHNPGTYFAVGTHQITYTVTDGSGNTSTCTFAILVTDDDAPQVTCAAAVASCDSIINYSFPIASDNCGISTLTQIAGLPSGSVFPVGTTYNTFLATDIHGNSTTCSSEVIVFPKPVLSILALDVSCNTLADGLIDLTIINGEGPFEFVWNNDETTEDLIGIAPGEYSVLVTDNNNCSATTSVSISEPVILEISSSEIPVSCYNGTNGAIDLEVTGGSLPYSYIWNNEESSQDLENLPAGIYSVTVIDGHGCNSLFETEITEPDSLIIAAQISNAICTAANGSIQTQITGGTAPYGFVWSNGSAAANLTNVLAGSYTLFVTDSLNCVAQYAGTIEADFNLEARLMHKDNLCFGDESGQVEVSVVNGNAPYTYEWSNGGSTQLLENLTAGNYSVTVTDVFGCELELNVELLQPDSLYIELFPSVYTGGFNISTYNGYDGYINSAVYGGEPEYIYSWSNGATNPNISNLNASTYTLMVMDQNGCRAYASIIMTQPDILEMPNGYSPNGDGDNDAFVVHGIEAYPDNELVIYNRWGNIVYSKTNYANEWDGNNKSGESLPDATYFAILRIFGDKEMVLKGYVDLRR